MSHKIIETTSHDYRPVNKYIDEKARLKRTKSIWGYTRSLALFLLALGIFLILAAYAYYIFKKPHYLNPDNNKLMQEDKKYLLNEELKMKEEKIKDLEKKLKESPDNRLLQDEISKLQNEKNDLKNQIEQQKNIHTNFIKFEWNYNASINGNNVSIATRFKYKDSMENKPEEINCYVDFNRDDLATLELGTKYNPFPDGISNVYKEKLGANDNDFKNLRNYCNFD
tara:strand:+ start:694 stop:1368 length:675 start_codon:yes stop_codon:yes gene_type:complete